MTIHIVRYWFVCLVFTITAVSPAGLLHAQEVRRERMFDGVVHLQDSLITHIPEVDRLCHSMDVSQRKIQIGDIQLYVEEGGQGQALVLIHGGPGGTHHYFHPWFSRAHDFARVIYYDQRGTGLSDYESGPDGYSVEQATDDLEALRKALGIEKWVLLGHSYGGFLAQYYTLRYPERVAGLVLVASSTGTWGGTKRGRTMRYISQEEDERYDSIRSELGEWADAHALTDSEYVSLLLYNRFLNGFWKFQYLYRPTRERIARLALYEWTDQGEFRSQISTTQRRIDFRGAFDDSPIPTLIVEGCWDLTWDTDKAEFIHAIHPSADLVVFGMAGHEIFGDVPDRFFSILEGFLRDLPDVPYPEIVNFRSSINQWDTELKASPEYLLRSAGDDQASSERIAEAYSPEWLPGFKSPDRFYIYFERIGLALYDTRRFEEALAVFTEMQEAAEKYGLGERIEAWISMIWQGHLLDLLGRREEAVRFYQQAVDLGLTGNWGYSQYGLQYQCTEYASRWLKEPFQYINNRR